MASLGAPCVPELSRRLEMSLITKIKHSSLKLLLKKISLAIYKIGTRFGVHIVPVHYYTPLANPIALSKTKELWAKKSSLPGVDIDLGEQVENLRKICLPFQSEYQGNRAYLSAINQRYGPGYGYIEAQAFHGILRSIKPRRLIEVGSGVSTYCALQALQKNREESGSDFSVTCIEPYPSDTLKATPDVELISDFVQKVPIETFSNLKENDILFIDSSHTVKPGGDVNYLFLEILPRLNPGVIVHVHDIYFPYDYPRTVLDSYLQWMETSLLRAFLIHNRKARIIFCLSHLHYDRQKALLDVFPEYQPQADESGLRVGAEHPFAEQKGHFPSSIYFQVQA